jgi:acyl-[acyl-carrier-protein]-phospholipid O-acyltransferase/long-chain-fatty-acid--[acyl-carrier-protein] ligase
MASHLLNSRRFLPLLLTQFLGTLNDHFFKTALVVLVTYRMAGQMHVDAMQLVALAGAFFVLPYTIFCATGGKIADKYDKAAVGFHFHMLAFLFAVLFCMGTHSAFFSPVKYALLPDHLRTDELVEGNAFIEGCTFVAILLGTIAGGVLILRPHGEAVVSGMLLTFAVLGVISSRFILPATTRDPKVKVSLNPLRETKGILSYLFRRPDLIRASLANSWFWFVCVPFMSLFAPYTEKVLGADQDVATLLLTTYAVGIGFGAAACGAVLKGTPSLKTVPATALCMSAFIFYLYAVSPHPLLNPVGELMTIGQFLKRPEGWHMTAALFMIAFFGGFYIVPLYAVLQQRCEPRHRAQTMAGNNVMNAFLMMGSALFALFVFHLGYSAAEVFLMAGVLNLCVGLWLFKAVRIILP